MRKACDLESHHQAHDRHGERFPGSGGVRQHDVALERGEIRIADTHARELSEAGVDAVDGLTFRNDPFNGPCRRIDARPALIREDCSVAAIDAAPFAKRDGAGP